jgi:glutamate formiminotransferase / formiminotetrahydrofolate cyclodeaminase
MNTPLVECIPNFSEAHRPEVIEAIVRAIQSVAGASLLDRHSDLDHNRTVLTFIGSPASVEEAAFQAIAKAAELINMDQHMGEHPRIGATDVIPFVPITGISMQECVAMARRLGSRVGSELDIPVYLYEEAASRPDRQNLENIRRGQYEGLKDEILTDPDRAPDFGPRQLGTAGASVIGARHPLIAFNVYLNTHDVDVARKIARAVRHSSGGMRHVKGLGLLVEGRAQVSMNLTNYHTTPIARVVELIRREAARYGTGIHHSELVGLIPEQALVEAAQWYLQLDQFDPNQILERRLAAAQETGPTPAPHSPPPPVGFLDALADGTASPGGGSAAAYSGALAAALVAMVARLTIGKKKYVAVEAGMQQVAEQAEALRLEMQTAVERDAEAFNAVMTAMRLPKETPEQQVLRLSTIQAATLTATRVPLRVAAQTVELLELVHRVAEQGNLNAISDAGTAAELALAALRGTALNVRINLTGLKDRATAEALTLELAALESRAESLMQDIHAVIRQRGGL